MNRFLNIFKYVLLLVAILLICLSLFSTNWALSTFEFSSFDEVLFQLTTPIKSASSSILSSYVSESLIRAIFAGVFVFIIIGLLIHYFSNNDIDFNIVFKNKSYDFIFNGKTAKRVIGFLCCIITVIIINYCLNNIKFYEYVKARSQESPFIKDNYVDPKKVNITFPEEKRNIVYIYVESLESTFFSDEYGGGDSNNYLAPLLDITRDNINFSDKDSIGGAYQAPGTDWTSAALIANTAGLPLKEYLDSVQGVSKMLPGATTLNDILAENGYNQMFMIGSNKGFGNRGLYFESHGNVEVYDYDSAKEEKRIPEDYVVAWGLDDAKLFEIAKDKMTELSHEDKPFYLSLLTISTHTKDGYIDWDCTGGFDTKYGNAIYCSAVQLAEFVRWIQEQDFYDNTTIVLVGDHVSMQPNFYSKDTSRRVYNVFINSKVEGNNYNNRVYNTMDFFPTTLASIGVEIEGDRLGLGTNLFSDRKTLMEEIGADTFNNELSKYSKFYMKNLYHS